MQVTTLRGIMHVTTLRGAMALPSSMSWQALDTIILDMSVVFPDTLLPHGEQLRIAVRVTDSVGNRAVNVSNCVSGDRTPSQVLMGEVQHPRIVFDGGNPVIIEPAPSSSDNSDSSSSSDSSSDNSGSNSDSRSGSSDSDSSSDSNSDSSSGSNSDSSSDSSSDRSSSYTMDVGFVVYNDIAPSEFISACWGTVPVRTAHGMLEDEFFDRCFYVLYFRLCVSSYNVLFVLFFTGVDSRAP
jgi:hypothetical protein